MLAFILLFVLFQGRTRREASLAVATRETRAFLGLNGDNKKIKKALDIRCA